MMVRYGATSHYYIVTIRTSPFGALEILGADRHFATLAVCRVPPTPKEPRGNRGAAPLSQNRGYAQGRA